MYLSLKVYVQALEVKTLFLKRKQTYVDVIGANETLSGRSNVIAILVERISAISKSTVILSSPPKRLSSLWRNTFLISIPSRRG
jgi:hypothetical protein